MKIFTFTVNIEFGNVLKERKNYPVSVHEKIQFIVSTIAAIIIYLYHNRIWRFHELFWQNVVLNMNEINFPI